LGNPERLEDEEVEERSDMTIEYEESSKSAEESDSGSEMRRMITDDMEKPDDTVQSINEEDLIHNIFGGGKA
jgi:hypothetical protein